MRAKLAGALLAPVLMLWAAGPLIAHEPAQVVLSDIRQETTDHSTRLVLECTGALSYTYYSPDPLTLVVDLPGVDASKVPAKANVQTREVESIRVTNLSRADGHTLARLEVRLASLVPYQIYSKDKTLYLAFVRPAPAAPAERTETSQKPPEMARENGAEKPRAADRAEARVAATPSPAAQAREDKPEPPKPATGARASRIVSVLPAQQNGELAVTIRADGRLRYQDFFLGNPDRLVLDFQGVVSPAAFRPIDVNQGPLRRVRLAQFSATSPKIARLALDLSSRAAYRIVEASDGVKIVFGEGGHPAGPAPLAALRSEVEPAPEPDPGPQVAPAAASTAPAVPPTAAAAPQAAALTLEAPPAAAPPAAPPAAAPPPVAVPVIPEPQAPPPAPPPETPKDSFEARTLGGGKKTFTGHPISLDFKDGDLQDIFRLFADISGLNVVVNPGVSGKVTLKLNEVPWDQALDLILKTNGLGYTLDDNVIRIARLSDLQKEEADRRKLQEEQALAGELVVLRKPLSYAKAGDLEATVRKVALSARGTITLDQRTNEMIITDLPANIEKAKDLIADLDRATPQVEIEARIVVTSRNFTRDLGIQWGFNQQRTARFGNTTDLVFPNQYILNGQGVPASQGLAPDQVSSGGNTPQEGIGNTGRGYAVNLPAAGFNSAIGIAMGNILGNFNLDAALTALERQGRGRILSTPKITTQNNQPAEIKQGVQIPIQTVANNTVTVQFKDAVLTLKVTPQITDAATVILGLEVENNTPDFANRVNGIPPINTQSAKTQVLVRDGATAVVGGIYKSNEQTSLNSTPFFSKIPILGYLFRARFVTSTNDELLLFVTPRITK